MKTTFSLVLTAALMLAAGGAAQAQNPSGMLLGIRAFPNWMGLRVTSTIPGYSAHGVLFRNDVLLRATTDGVTILPVRDHDEIEFAKDQIGPGVPAALEIFRPGVGKTYLWVEFQPIDGAVRHYKADFATEEERPGARALFQGGDHGGQPMPGEFPPGGGFPGGGFPSGDRPADPASLFGRP